MHFSVARKRIFFAFFVTEHTAAHTRAEEYRPVYRHVWILTSAEKSVSQKFDLFECDEKHAAEGKKSTSECWEYLFANLVIID